jgi:hypothetical protein
LVRRPLFDLLYQLRMINYDECEAVGGMRIGRENRSTRRKPAPVSLCPPQIPHDLTRAPTRAAEVGSRRLTARPVATLLQATIQIQLHSKFRWRREGTSKDMKAIRKRDNGKKISLVLSVNNYKCKNCPVTRSMERRNLLRFSNPKIFRNRTSYISRQRISFITRKGVRQKTEIAQYIESVEHML